MPDKIVVELGDVQRTLFLPLWGRAIESMKEDPLLADQTAAQIINKIDYDFSIMARNLDDLTQFAWIARSLLMDRIINEFLKIHPKGTIVNIGCGLDTTFDRVDNGKLHWFDLDLPDVIELRKKFIPQNQRRILIACSFLDNAWFHQLKTEENVLFMAAGVFYYFEQAQIKEFFGRIANLFPGSEMVFDASSPLGVKMANKLVIKNSGLDERSFLKWGLRNTKEIQRWDNRIRILAEYAYFRNMKKGLTLRNRIGGFISDALKIQWLIHLKFQSLS
jgi:O-methyltransferase involved in polyketide biosynthesis